MQYPMPYTAHMANTWQQSQAMREYTGAVGLLAAIKDGLELDDDAWAKLYDTATPYQRRCARLILDPTCAPHGVPGTYTNWGCRCTDCTKAATAARAGRSTDADFATASDQPDTTPDQIKALQREQAAGRTLTPKGAQVLADWEAAQVL